LGLPTDNCLFEGGGGDGGNIETGLRRLIRGYTYFFSQSDKSAEVLIRKQKKKKKPKKVVFNIARLELPFRTPLVDPVLPNSLL